MFCSILFVGNSRCVSREESGVLLKEKYVRDKER